ncbi:RNA-binding protein [Methanosarcinales archaeon]|nr:MAG: RNA-binding protein [Methanosarcinales archaeon]
MAKTASSYHCNSCGVALRERGFTRFPCPICGTVIGRCARCRTIGAQYICPKCGFTGP